MHTKHCMYNNMVSGFRRSISFPTPKPSPASSGRQTVRSISLPCRFHPLVAQLDDDVRSLLAWLETRTSADSSASIADGLTRLEHLYSSLVDLLRLPHALDTLRRMVAGGRRAGWTERLLDGFLRLADAFGTFRSAIVTLRQNQLSTQAAIRRGDEARIASCVREQRRAEQEMARLALSVGRDIPRTTAASSVVASSDAAEVEMVGIMWEVVVVSAAASAAVFSGIATSSPLVPAPASRLPKCMVGPLLGRKNGKEDEEEGEKRRQSALKRLEELQECFAVTEEKSERVFTSLINTRVSLLNILTPSL